MICILEVVKGPAKGRTCSLRLDQSLKIGRMSSSDLKVDDPHLSRNHFIVEGVGTYFRVRDAGSSNGTFVNSTRVSATRLCPGDHIQAGGTVFEVHLQEAFSEPKPPASPISTPYCLDPIASDRSRAEKEEVFNDKSTKRLSLDPELKFILGKSLENSAYFDRRQTANLRSEVGHDDVSIESGAFPEAFISAFRVDPESLLQQQREDVPGGVQNVLESLLDWDGLLGLIINVGQITREQKDYFDAHFSANEKRRLSQSLYFLEPLRKADAIAFYLKCLGRDAAVFVGSQSRLTDSWLRNVANSVSFPSLLYCIANDSMEKAQQVANSVDFVLFESANNRFFLLSELVGQQEAALSSSSSR